MQFGFFWSKIRQLEDAYDKRRRAVAEEFSLSAAEVDVLLFLANNPGFDTAADIVRTRRMAKSHVSLAVNSLCARGYLEKLTDSDNRRVNRLAVTEEAARAVEFGRARQGEFFSSLFSGFSEEEKHIFASYCLRVFDNLDAAGNTEDK